MWCVIGAVASDGRLAKDLDRGVRMLNVDVAGNSAVFGRRSADIRLPRQRLRQIQHSLTLLDCFHGFPRICVFVTTKQRKKALFISDSVSRAFFVG